MWKPALIIQTAKVVGGKCYACDAKAVGLRDCRPEGGELEKACERHAEARAQAICSYCMGGIRRGALDVDGYWAHVRCERAAILS